MRVWITKFVLTRGIFIAEGTPKGDGLVEAKWRRQGHDQEGWFFKGDWHTDRESAVKKAKQMRDDEVAKLTKRIAKLESMEF